MRMDCWHRYLNFKYGEGKGPPPLFPRRRKINVGERYFPRKRPVLIVLDATDAADDPAPEISNSSSDSSSDHDGP